MRTVMCFSHNTCFKNINSKLVSLEKCILKNYNKWSWPKRVMEIAFYIYYGDSGKKSK